MQHSLVEEGTALTHMAGEALSKACKIMAVASGPATEVAELLQARAAPDLVHTCSTAHTHDFCRPKHFSVHFSDL